MTDISEKVRRAARWGASHGTEAADIWLRRTLRAGIPRRDLIQVARDIHDKHPRIVAELPTPADSKQAMSEQDLQDELGLTWDMAAMPEPGTSRYLIIDAYWNAWRSAATETIKRDIRRRAFPVGTLVRLYADPGTKCRITGWDNTGEEGTAGRVFAQPIGLLGSLDPDIGQIDIWKD